MQHDIFQTTAQQWIALFDQGAHRAITGWRQGGEQLGQMARGRWDSAFAESSPQLSEETRRNASHFRDVVAGCYTRGVSLSAEGAERAVTTLVSAARATLGGRMPR